MKKENVFFGDPFKWTRPLYFGKFGRSAIGRMRDSHPPKAAFLQPLAEDFEAKAGLILENGELKEGKVSDANDFIEEFSTYVTDVAEGAIRYAARGKEGALYKDFFPEGKTPYSAPAKIEMPLLTQHLRKMAVKHAPALPPEVVSTLQAYEGRWDAAFEQQETGKSDVNETKDDYKQAYQAYVKGIVKTMHEIAAEQPCDVEYGKRFFDFSQLHPAATDSAEAPATPAAAAVS